MILWQGTVRNCSTTLGLSCDRTFTLSSLLLPAPATHIYIHSLPTFHPNQPALINPVHPPPSGTSHSQISLPQLFCGNKTDIANLQSWFSCPPLLPLTSPGCLEREEERGSEASSSVNCGLWNMAVRSLVLGVSLLLSIWHYWHLTEQLVEDSPTLPPPVTPTPQAVSPLPLKPPWACRRQLTWRLHQVEMAPITAVTPKSWSPSVRMQGTPPLWMPWSSSSVLL